MSTKLSPFEMADNINKKTGFLDVDEVGFEPFIVNRVFSNTVDTIFFANEMNANWQVPKDMQYAFFYYGVTKKSGRFGKWQKRDKGDDAAIAIIQEFHGFSRIRALEVLELLRPYLADMKSQMDKGGRHGRKES